MIKKIADTILVVAAINMMLMVSANATNFSHINTFGFDYISFDNRLGQLSWLAKRHDWIIGPSNHGFSLRANRIQRSVYSTIKKANPETKIMMYLAYNSILEDVMGPMELWSKKNGRNPEDLYYHYYFDTTINTTKGKLTIPGYGGGSAESLKEARVKSRWWGGRFPNINPSSQTFRDAFNAIALELVTVRQTRSKYADGLFLDTFNGTTEIGHWSLHLERTIDLRRRRVKTEAEAVEKVNRDLVASKVELQKYLSEKTGNPSFIVLPNAAEPAYMYHWYKDLFETYKESSLRELSVEFLVRSTSDRSLIPYMKRLYDDMMSGRRLWIRSQTNYGRSQKIIPFKFSQFILAVHYLINHKNGYFFYHEGSPSNYGGTPFGNLQQTHWHRNMEIDIGKPMKTDRMDYWGKKGTNRFFVFADSGNAIVVGREYTKALVLAKFGLRGGFDNIGSNVEVYKLERKYRPLNENNSLGKPVDSYKLGNSEGVILIK